MESMGATLGDDLVAGFNTSVVAMGQSGSGKSTTLFGISTCMFRVCGCVHWFPPSVCLLYLLRIKVLIE